MPLVNQTELRQRLLPILEAEELGDWDQVEQLSDALNRELAEQNFANSPEIVNHYLDDADIREKDHRYGERQRRTVARFVDTGEYKDSTPIPWWSCALLAAVIIAAVMWLLT